MKEAGLEGAGLGGSGPGREGAMPQADRIVR